jgi:hypothetical protein
MNLLAKHLYSQIWIWICTYVAACHLEAWPVSTRFGSPLCHADTIARGQKLWNASSWNASNWRRVLVWDAEAGIPSGYIMLYPQQAFSNHASTLVQRCLERHRYAKPKLVGGFKHLLICFFSIIYIYSYTVWDTPSHWRTHIFQDGYCTTRQLGSSLGGEKKSNKK